MAFLLFKYTFISLHCSYIIIKSNHRAHYYSNKALQLQWPVSKIKMAQNSKRNYNVYLLTPW